MRPRAVWRIPGVPKLQFYGLNCQAGADDQTQACTIDCETSDSSTMCPTLDAEPNDSGKARPEEGSWPAKIANMGLPNSPPNAPLLTQLHYAGTTSDLSTAQTALQSNTHLMSFQGYPYLNSQHRFGISQQKSTPLKKAEAAHQSSTPSGPSGGVDVKHKFIANDSCSTTVPFEVGLSSSNLPVTVTHEAEPPFANTTLQFLHVQRPKSSGKFQPDSSGTPCNNNTGILDSKRSTKRTIVGTEGSPAHVVDHNSPQPNTTGNESDAFTRFLSEKKKVRTKLEQLSKVDDGNFADAIPTSTSPRLSPTTHASKTNRHDSPANSLGASNSLKKETILTPLASSLKCFNGIAGVYRPPTVPESNLPSRGMNEKNNPPSLRSSGQSPQLEVPPCPTSQSIPPPEVFKSDSSASLNQRICRQNQSPPLAILESLSGRDESYTELETDSMTSYYPQEPSGKPDASKYGVRQFLNGNRSQQHDPRRMWIEHETPPLRTPAENTAPLPSHDHEMRGGFRKEPSACGHVGRGKVRQDDFQGDSYINQSRSPISSSPTPSVHSSKRSSSVACHQVSRSRSFKMNPLAGFPRLDSIQSIMNVQGLDRKSVQHPPSLGQPFVRLPSETDLTRFPGRNGSPTRFSSFTRASLTNERGVESRRKAASFTNRVQSVDRQTDMNARGKSSSMRQSDGGSRRDWNMWAPFSNSQGPTRWIERGSGPTWSKAQLCRSSLDVDTEFYNRSSYPSPMLSKQGDGEPPLLVCRSSRMDPGLESETNTLRNIMSPEAESTLKPTKSYSDEDSCQSPCPKTIALQEELRYMGIPLESTIDQREISFAVSEGVDSSGTNHIVIPDASPADLHRKGFILHKINSGTFCSVFRARYRQFDVAVKCPDETLLRSDGEMMRCRALQEWKILSRTSHPSILSFHGGVIVRNQIWLVTEYVRGGDLYTLLYHRPVEFLLPHVRLSFMEQLCDALAYLHSLEPRIAHKDIKCNNLLVGNGLTLKVCDFGDAEEMKGQFLQRCTAATWQYSPPELIGTEDPSRPKGSTEQVDVWAMGCVFLELLKCSTPFVHILDSVAEDRQRSILRQCFLENRLEAECRIPKSLPRDLRRLISLCLSFDARRRPTSNEVLELIISNRENLLMEMNLWQSHLESPLKTRTSLHGDDYNGNRYTPYTKKNAVSRHQSNGELPIPPRLNLNDPGGLRSCLTANQERARILGLNEDLGDLQHHLSNSRNMGKAQHAQPLSQKGSSKMDISQSPLPECGSPEELVGSREVFGGDGETASDKKGIRGDSVPGRLKAHKKVIRQVMSQYPKLSAFRDKLRAPFEAVLKSGDSGEALPPARNTQEDSSSWYDLKDYLTHNSNLKDRKLPRPVDSRPSDMSRETSRNLPADGASLAERLRRQFAADEHLKPNFISGVLNEFERNANDAPRDSGVDRGNLTLGRGSFLRMPQRATIAERQKIAQEEARSRPSNPPRNEAYDEASRLATNSYRERPRQYYHIEKSRGEVGVHPSAQLTPRDNFLESECHLRQLMSGRSTLERFIDNSAEKTQMRKSGIIEKPNPLRMAWEEERRNVNARTQEREYTFNPPAQNGIVFDVGSCRMNLPNTVDRDHSNGGEKLGAKMSSQFGQSQSFGGTLSSRGPIMDPNLRHIPSAVPLHKVPSFLVSRESAAQSGSGRVDSAAALGSYSSGRMSARPILLQQYRRESRPFEFVSEEVSAPNDAKGGYFYTNDPADFCGAGIRFASRHGRNVRGSTWRSAVDQPANPALHSVAATLYRV